MKYYLKEITYVEFFNHINFLLENIKNEKNSLEEINNDIDIFLEQHIYPDTELFKDILEANKYSIYNSFRARTNHEFDEYERNDFYKRFVLLKDYLSIIDYFDKPEEYVIIDGITEKSEFLLDKLNKLFNDNYYSISLVFKINNIEFRDGEPREIAENLFKRGYLKLEKEYGDSDLAMISIKGANFIERKNKTKSKEKSNNKKETELDKKLDQIKEYLVKLGYGQEIIFEEIEELRNLQTTISKKSWKQLLKGKLFDLALEEVLSKDTVNQIFEFLTDSSIKLLK